MKKKMIIFKRLGSVVLISASCLLSFACTNKAEGDTPIKQGNPGKPGSEKPDKKSIEAALNDKVLLQLFEGSIIKAANSEVVTFYAKLIPNNDKTNIITWGRGISVKIGESAGPFTYDGAYGLDALNLGLKLTVKRIEKSKSKTDLGYLVLTYELQRIGNQQDPSKRSYLLVIIEVNKIMNSKPVVAQEVIYPIAEDFSLDSWIAKQLKKP
jgi:hypothetical protein